MKGGVLLFDITLGIITRNFYTIDPVDKFLDNAEKNGHKVNNLVITYSEECDFALVKELDKRVRTFAIKTSDDDLKQQLIHRGMDKEDVDTLLRCPMYKNQKIVPYGKNRNHTVIQSMLINSDVLFFVDTDVYPWVLVENGKKNFKEIDFFGSHIKYLSDPEVKISTSDYSGYFIIPPMDFEKMDNFFFGLQKENVYDFVRNYREHDCLFFDSYENRRPFETNKILGGNLGIKLDVFKEIEPFYSNCFDFGDNCYLTRGEDTVLGLKIQSHERFKAMDIDMRIFHNTFGNYPDIPDIKGNEAIVNRFYFACVGWLGRNPFLNWIKGEDLKMLEEYQYENLLKSSFEASRYFNDDRFLDLPEILRHTYDNVGVMIRDYYKFKESWFKLMNKL